MNKPLLRLIASSVVAASMATAHGARAPSIETTINLVESTCSDTGGSALVDRRGEASYTILCKGSQFGSFVLIADLDVPTNAWKQSAVFDWPWTDRARHMAAQLNSLNPVFHPLRTSVSKGVMTIEYQAAGAPSCTPLPGGAWKCCWKEEAAGQ